MRSDSVGATHAFADHCRSLGIEFSFGYFITESVQQVVDQIPEQLWTPAINTDGSIRDGAWVVEATDYVNISSWPTDTRLILRKERPHPGAQLSFTDEDGHRVTAFITDTPPRVVDHQIQGLERRHRQHARVEDRIRQAKATGLARFPAAGFAENQAWLQVVMIANDLITWTKLIAYRGHPTIGRAEIAAFRYMILHTAHLPQQAQETLENRPPETAPSGLNQPQNRFRDSTDPPSQHQTRTATPHERGRLISEEPHFCRSIGLTGPEAHTVAIIEKTAYRR